MIPPLLFLAISLVDGWRWDEKLILTVAAIGTAGLTWAFAETSAEGALRPQRLAFRWSGRTLGVVFLFVAARIWL